jgi:molecular chaperone IbpA
MTTFDPFNMLDAKFFVGYEPMVKRMNELSQSISKSIPNYPPYNIVKVDDNKYVIEMAVAGFGKHNLDIEINDGTLSVSGFTDIGDLEKEGLNNHYLYKGIADRSFKRLFNISDTIEIKNAELFNGMLKIWLENIIPESKKPKKVEIVDPTEEVKSEKTFLAEGKK